MRRFTHLTKRYVYLALGWTALAFGAIGLVLPLLPTTPFLLLAAACFERGSPRFRHWLEHHVLFGPPIRDWRERGAIRPKAKALAVAMFAISFAVLLYSGRLPAVGLAVFAAFASAVCAFILTRPGR